MNIPGFGFLRYGFSVGSLQLAIHKPVEPRLSERRRNEIYPLEKPESPNGDYVRSFRVKIILLMDIGIIMKLLFYDIATTFSPFNRTILFL